MIKKIIIVGGGTAGWLSAGIIAADNARQGTGIQVQLVESPDIPTIGVGEGTWPTMRATLRRIGIPEVEFLTRCNASFKQGSKFVGWRNGTASDHYYHPFTFPYAYAECDIHAVWKKWFSHLHYGDATGLQGRACERQLAPKLLSTPDYAGVLNYGYHLDAGLFSELLKEHCTTKLGVKHFSDNVQQVVSGADGNIAHLKTEKSGDIKGDFFIDCSGSRSLLLGQHFGIDWVDRSEHSINDRALAVQVPYEAENQEIASATVATAQSSGWTWDIGLSTRRGVGYVYSSGFISDDAAEAELRQYLNNSSGRDCSGLEVRQIKFTAGHRQKIWHKNCVAIGMAAGFIEPLEASALAMVELSANFVRDEWPFTTKSLAILEKRFNAIFSYRWDKIVEFLKLHYALSERRDSDYWREVTNLSSSPESLNGLLELWRYRSPYFRDLLQSEEVFPSASYQYVLYGMGFECEGDLPERVSANLEAGRRKIDEGLSAWPRMESSLPTNRTLLNLIEQQHPRK
jgi:Tryptophan halogenase.